MAESSLPPRGVQIALVDISTELLQNLMHMPFTAKIVGVSMNEPWKNTIRLAIEDSQLPVTPLPVERTPTITEHRIEFKWETA